MTDEIKANFAITKCICLQETIQRIISTEIDNPYYKQEVKRLFNLYLKQGERLNNGIRGHLKLNPKTDNDEELFDTESDYFYDLFNEAYGFETHEQYEELIKFAKHLKNK